MYSSSIGHDGDYWLISSHQTARHLAEAAVGMPRSIEVDEDHGRYGDGWIRYPLDLRITEDRLLNRWVIFPAAPFGLNPICLAHRSLSVSPGFHRRL